MSADISPAAQCFGVYDQDSIVAFCGVVHFPHPNNPKIKRLHRLVVLPDYQGIGLGMKLFNFCAEYYHRQGFDVYTTMSAKNLIQALSRSPLWRAKRFSILKPSKAKTSKISYTCRKVKTATFAYVGSN